MPQTVAAWASGPGMGFETLQTAALPSLQGSLYFSCLERACSSVLAPRALASRKPKFARRFEAALNGDTPVISHAAFRLSFAVDFLLSGVPHHTVRVAIPCVGDIDHAILLQVTLRH